MPADLFLGGCGQAFRSVSSGISERRADELKRADLAFARPTVQLPMEVKGQWHAEVWGAASAQLDAQYLIDWRSESAASIVSFGLPPSDRPRRLIPP